MKRIVTAGLLLVFLFCGGCSRRVTIPQSTAHRVVTEVHVFYQNGPIRAQRHYVSSEKMQAVLNYLRLLNPYGILTPAPEDLSGSDFDIVLTYSDGSEKHYRQYADLYLQEGDGQWQQIDPKKAAELSRLLCQMESDQV